MRGLALALFACGLAASCRRASPGLAVDAAPAPAAPSSSAAVDASTGGLAAPRCAPKGLPLRLGDAPPSDPEIGDAVAGPSGVAVGLVLRGSGGAQGPPVAAVALLPADASSARLVTLGPTLGDAPPPRIAARVVDWVAAWYPLSQAGSRDLAVASLSAAGEVARVGAVPQQRDDSFAFDLVPGLVAWDEDAPSPPGAKEREPRGVVRVAELGADGHAGPTRDASPPESDADSPRLAWTGAGALLFWIARRPEARASGDGSAVEVTGEAPAFGWLEAVALDPHGAPRGALRRLTSPTGHVSVFDVAPSAVAGEVLVVARDDGEATDGSGGSLLRLRVREGAADPAVAFPTDGLGRGAPSFVDGAPPWLSWVALREESRLLPLDGAGSPLGAASVEPALEDARPLARLRGGPPGATLVATPADPSGVLRVLSCPQGPG